MTSAAAKHIPQYVAEKRSIKPISYYVLDIKEFWAKFEDMWQDAYRILVTGANEEKDTIADTFNSILSEKLAAKIKLEVTVSMINKVYFEEAKNIVELYISPRLLIENIPIMEEMIRLKPTLPNLNIIKYKAFHPSDPLIDEIEALDMCVKYSDFGCQTSMAYDEKKFPVLNLVIFLKKAAASKILSKQKVSFKNAAGELSTIERWLPTDTNIVDIVLLNIVGEYNFIHHIGYIDFLPEGDPLIAEGSVFTDLESIREDLKLVLKMRSLDAALCHTCMKNTLQSNLLICGKCRKTFYCGRMCQRIDFKEHSKRCTA